MNYWIGLNDRRSEGVFVWLDSTVVSNKWVVCSTFPEYIVNGYYIYIFLKKRQRVLPNPDVYMQDIRDHEIVIYPQIMFHDKIFSIDVWNTNII